ncbi:hypothetical protein YC2023_035476 [Brassica napus]
MFRSALCMALILEFSTLKVFSDNFTRRKQGDSDGGNRRNRPIPTNFRRTRPSVSFRRKKKIRRNFVRTSDDFLTNTEKRHSDELPTILRYGYTRPEFIGKTTYRRRTFLGQFRRRVFLGVFRRTLGVGIYRRTTVVGIYRRTSFVGIFRRKWGSSVNSDGYMFVDELEDIKRSSFCIISVLNFFWDANSARIVAFSERIVAFSERIVVFCSSNAPIRSSLSCSSSRIMGSAYGACEEDAGYEEARRANPTKRPPFLLGTAYKNI